MSKMMKAFSERLKELRIEKGLSAKRLGELIGVSDAAIIKWENMQTIPSGENIYNIAVYFGVSADYLIGLED